MRVLVRLLLLVGQITDGQVRGVQLVQGVVDLLDAVDHRVEQLILDRGVDTGASCLHLVDLVGNERGVLVDGRQERTARHALHRTDLDVHELRVLLQFHLVAAASLHLGEHVELLEQLDALLRDVGRQRIGGGAVVGQAAALGLGGPLVGVTVAVEDDALVLLQRLLDVGDGGGLELVAGLALHGVGEVLQRLCHGGVEHHVAVGQVHRRARHAELELIAGEGEGAGAVTVGIVLQEVRQNRNTQVDGHLFSRGVLMIVNQRVHDGAQLVAQEDGHDSRRGLVGAQTMVVAAGGHGHAQQLLVIVDGLDDAGEEHQESQVVHGGFAGIQEVGLAGGDGPVVVLAGAVDALERLLMLQAHQAVMACQQAHLLHGQEVLVDGAVAVGVERGQLMLRRGDLVMLGLRRYAQLPQLAVEFLHELVDRGTDGAEVMLLELLALQRGVAEQRAARHDEVGALCVILLADQEVLLLGADGGDHAVDMFAEQRQHAFSLLVDGAHGA